MKTYPTEVRIRNGKNYHYFGEVPRSVITPILTSLKKYRETPIPWRELAKERISKQGSESGYFLRVAREGMNLTQTQLAKRLNMPQGNISQIETGHRPVGKVLAKRLAKIFNLDYRVFL